MRAGAGLSPLRFRVFRLVGIAWKVAARPSGSSVHISSVSRLVRLRLSYTVPTAVRRCGGCGIASSRGRWLTSALISMVIIPSNVRYWRGCLMSNAVPVTIKRPRRTPAQMKALKAYNFALAQEDRYMGSVFVTAMGQRDYEAKTAAAYAVCKGLGMTWEHGV